ncbi:MAG: hypothetical protein ACPGPS_16945 [Rubripirellula sp.]
MLCFVDDLGRNGLGCYGPMCYETPRIDRLAKQGIVLARVGCLGKGGQFMQCLFAHPCLADDR